MPAKSGSAIAPFPSHDEILAFIAREKEAGAPAGAIGKREIARAFNLKGADRIALKRVLKELESDGAVVKSRRALSKPGALPSVVLAEIFGRDPDGDLLARPVDWEGGARPTILVQVPRRPRPGEPIPGVGDQALLRTERASGEGPAYTGRVVKLIRRVKTQVLGIFKAGPSGGGRLLPIDKKNSGRELTIPPGAEGEAQDGDLVSVEIARGARLAAPHAAVRERLGSLASERAVSLIAIHAHGIPNVFRPDALAEAERALPARLHEAGITREDWRDLPLITIDPRDAKDHDDAVYAAPDPERPGGFVVTVAIADVAAYVRPGSALDREALDRGNSVYFPDRVVPMLPVRISNDLCSLRADEDRPALAVRLVLDAGGHKISHSFHRIMMRSAAKLSYEQAQAAIDGRPDDTTAPLLDPVLRPLWAAYEAARQARDARAPLDLNLPERKLVLNPDGTVDRVVTPERLEAHRLIEEFMILANVAAAETLEDKRQVLIYRAHDEPSVEKLTALAEFLATIRIKLAKGQVLRPAQFNGILARVRDTEHEHLVNEVVLRSQAQAEYAAENYGHFGLNLRRYAHFTSPIRRYADLVVHRALIRALHLGSDGLPNLTLGDLSEVAQKISAAERRAMTAERETTDRLIATWLADRIGATFAGRISGVTRAGLFVKLAETGADGFIPAATLGTDYFRFDEAARALIGSRSGETHRLGDLVDVRLVEAAPFAGALRFELLSEGSRRSASTGRTRDTKASGAGARVASRSPHKSRGKRR